MQLFLKAKRCLLFFPYLFCVFFPVLFTLIGIWGVWQTSLAQEFPRALASDNRIKIVNYRKDNVVPVLASTFTTTQIVFNKHEVIENIQNGDLDAWTLSVEKNLPNMLFLKPTIVGSHTNMTVVTNHHTYYFQLTSKAQNKIKKNATYAIIFTYPHAIQAKMQKAMRFNAQQQRAILNAHQNPQNYNWNYSFNGNRTIMPLHIFDDGRFTYMQLRKGQTVPAIFAVNNAQGKESVVNYRQDGRYIVVQQVAPQFTLRSGKKVVSIFNNRLIQQEHLR